MQVSAAVAVAGTPAPPTVDAIMRDLHRLKNGRGAADVRRFREAHSLALIPGFQSTPDDRAKTFWSYVDTIRDAVEMAPPTQRPGRTAPPGREWHRLLETIFNRSCVTGDYTKRLRSVSSQLPVDFPVLSTYYGVTSATSSRMSEAATDAVHLLARWIAVRGSIDPLDPPSEAPADPVHTRGGSTAIATAASVAISTSSIQYSQLIVAHEHAATQIDRIPKRLSVLFKSEEAVVDIAEQRFGPGSSQIDAYVREHRERKSQFYSQLSDGLRCREIYAIPELKAYLATGAHGRSVHLDREHVQANVANWLECLERYPDYIVALTEEAVPFKYEVINAQTVVIHQAIGGNDRDRLNAIFLTGIAAGRLFQNDFDLIWDRTPIEYRQSQNVITWASNVANGE